MNRILVNGGAGFIGSRLCEKLLAQGNEVTCLDNYFTGSNLVYLPLPEDDPKQRKPDISLEKKELNWQPVIDLETGLGRTIEYFKSI